MKPSKIHTKEFIDSLTNAEKFRIAGLVVSSMYLSFDDAAEFANLEIERQRADKVPPKIDDKERCEAEMTLEDEVLIGKYRCELHDDHYNQLHQITYPGLDGYIEVPIYWSDEDYKIYVRRGKQYFSCPGCGFETYDENDLNNRLCVDCDQFHQHNEESQIQY